MTNLFVQAHFDDVPWSCGGTLKRLSEHEPCIVVTVFDRSPDPARSLSLFARFLHRTWGAGRDPLPMRRRENDDALAILGATGEGLCLHEALYRDPPVQTSGQLLRAPGPSLAPLADEIAARLVGLATRLEGGAARVFLPLGVATHVDHVLCYAAHTRLREAGLDVYHYEDVPYVTKPGKLAQRLAETPGLSSFTVDVASTIGARLEAVHAYRSQLGFFGSKGPDHMVRSYAASVSPGGLAERFWTRDAAPALPWATP